VALVLRWLAAPDRPKTTCCCSCCLVEMLPLLPLVYIAVAAESSSCTHSSCACAALEISGLLHRTHRAARRLAAGLETGLLDNIYLEEAQSEVGASVDALRRMHLNCGRDRNACAAASIQVRRSCECRPVRLLNTTTNVQHRLDDAAAGVLFGDSDANMLTLTNTLPPVMHGLARVGGELERLGSACVQNMVEGGG
jgi:hypothetical protein